MPRKKTSTKTRQKKTVSRKPKKRKIEKLKKSELRAPKGTFDILPEEQKYWSRIREVIEKLAYSYGFSRIDTPIFEDARLFEKGTGISSDIVQKEMYVFKTKGGYRLALRPEFTPGIVRAYIQHGMKNLPQPVRLFSVGPVFRHEKPQAGRFRQFHQFNFEIIGDSDPINEALLIWLVSLIFKKLGIKKFNIEINNIGCSECRGTYRKLLIDYYSRLSRKLCPNCRKRLKLNPLRLLDCKEEKCKRFIEDAPQIIDYLCEECHNHFKGLLEILDELEVPYILNPYLVRGLDYYTKTVFEFKLENSEAGELAGGGRYDNLIELYGEKPTPAVGVAGGIERIISVLKAQDIKIPSEPAPSVFLAHLGDLGRKKSLALFEKLRSNGIRVAESLSKGSIKSQLKLADKLGIKIVLILGQKEVLENNIIIRDMDSGVQEIIPLDKLIKRLKKKIREI